MAADHPITVPDGYKLHTENTSHILLPATNEAFLNPIQEFNRDLSVACIRTWSQQLDKAKEAKWEKRREKRLKEPGSDKKRAKKVLKTSETGVEKGIGLVEEFQEDAVSGEATNQPAKEAEVRYRPNKIVILEALSATGLRSIRYAKEIPLVKYVIANDLSPLATAAMARNVEINGLGAPTPSSLEEAPGSSEAQNVSDERKPRAQNLGVVRINEGDACALMYNHRPEKHRVDVVDLDPYGTAAPFIDPAVQCINDGGLLCVTCTDLAVLATTNYPEKCYSNYGGIPVKAEYCHEAALRLVLHTVSTSAARYGRYVQPLLSLSIDFYVRLFIRIQTAPIEVKKAASKTAMYYICSGCQAFYEQPIGRMTEKVHEPSGQVNIHFKTAVGPTVSGRCPECDSTLHLAGPMWSGPIQDRNFVSSVLEHVEGEDQDKYGTANRMKGMLTVAQEELDSPFYFSPSRMAGSFHCVSPSLDETASALLHAGHKVSRSHAMPGSLKTSARDAEVHDVFRSWVKTHPVKMEKISEHSPTRQLLAKESSMEHNFTTHPDSVMQSSKVKLVRYQQNPTKYWGPGTKADSGKRKRETADD